MTATVENLLYGLYAGSATAAALSGLLFVRYWKVSRDRLYLFFASALWAFALGWVANFLTRADEYRPFVLLLRLTGFALIIAAILDKNRRTG